MAAGSHTYSDVPSGPVDQFQSTRREAAHRHATADGRTAALARTRGPSAGSAGKHRPRERELTTRKIAQQPISLETPIGEDEGFHVGDLIEDKGVVSPSEAAIGLDLRDQMASMLKALTPREERIIRMRFGLEDGTEHDRGGWSGILGHTRAHPSN